jgi:hypothetical protein
MPKKVDYLAERRLKRKETDSISTSLDQIQRPNWDSIMSDSSLTPADKIKKVRNGAEVQERAARRREV